MIFPFRNVFLGLALDKLNNNDDAEKAYLAATRAKEGDKTAWQGLVGLYEKQGADKLEAYREAVINLCQIFAEAYVSELPAPPSSGPNDADTGPVRTNTAVKMSSTSTSPLPKRMDPDRSTEKPSSCIYQQAPYTPCSRDEFPIRRIPINA